MDREEIIIQRGESSDVNDIIDFGNFVFSMAHRPHSFDSLLPKCYGEGQNHADWHYLVKDNKRIQAMLMSMPQVVSMQHVYPGVVFQRNGIGTVSVHHRARSKGYMRELMNEALQDMWDDGVAYSFLGGQRQRYRYFGYDHAGTVLNASLSLRNMTMTWPSLRDLQVPDDMSLIDCPVSGPILDQVYNLYLKTHALNVRPKEDFALICRTFGRQAKVLLRGGDEVLAYIVGTEDLSHVDEIVKADAALPWEWLLFYLINLANVQLITFSLPQAIVGEALDLQRALLFAAENYSIVSGGMIRCLILPRRLRCSSLRKRFNNLWRWVD